MHRTIECPMRMSVSVDEALQVRVKSQGLDEGSGTSRSPNECARRGRD